MLELFFTFFKLGLFTFGGGYAMIPLIKETIINKKGWMSEDEVLEMIAIAESTPGPIAINMATYIGHRQKGVLGSLLSTLGVILPSMIIIYLISLCFDMFLSNKYIQYAFTGIKCGVAILILKTGIEMLLKARKNIPYTIIAIVVTALMVALDILAINLSAIILILLGGIVVGVIGNIVKEKVCGDDIDKMVADIYSSAAASREESTEEKAPTIPTENVESTDTKDLESMIQDLMEQHSKDSETTDTKKEAIDTIKTNNPTTTKKIKSKEQTITLDDSAISNIENMFSSKKTTTKSGVKKNTTKTTAPSKNKEVK